MPIKPVRWLNPKGYCLLNMKLSDRNFDLGFSGLKTYVYCSNWFSWRCYPM